LSLRVVVRAAALIAQAALLVAAVRVVFALEQDFL
jgi:hypothetical protein